MDMYRAEVTSGIPTGILKELCEAYKEERCLILPAKEVFELVWDAGKECNLQCPICDEENECSCCIYGELCIYKKQCTQELAKHLGSTVFLTYEEAEIKKEKYLNDRY